MSSMESTVWVLFARLPRPDVPYWAGRRWLAAIDAVAWPGLCVLAVQNLLTEAGLMGAFACAWAVLAGLYRLQIALWNNHRYHLTTLRWAKLLSCVLVLGFLLRLFLGR
jgi:hypothetical protein